MDLPFFETSAKTGANVDEVQYCTLLIAITMEDLEVLNSLVCAAGGWGTVVPDGDSNSELSLLVRVVSRY